MTGDRFGLDGLDGFFGALRQDNRPAATNRWTDFFRERRIEPFLRAALDSGHLSKDLATQVESFAERTSERGGD